MAQQEGGTLLNSASEALQLCKDWIDKLFTERKFHLALCAYCNELETFMKRKRFTQLFAQAFEFKAILQEKSFGRQLEKDIEEVDGSSVERARSMDEENSPETTRLFSKKQVKANTSSRVHLILYQSQSLKSTVLEDIPPCRQPLPRIELACMKCRLCVVWSVLPDPRHNRQLPKPHPLAVDKSLMALARHLILVSDIFIPTSNSGA
ncbi:hypothetical protein BDB00DRAFT_875727 [Zychaea mexicana]|uniref:uncharacterized protein n=1 Tax=Zychaea mexicana TaxID=64656 RepID=UPI0022FE3A0D|nr:uncharacterized protein BDB00DRAFT_875727 [Zychaea mexicana]KAI9490028.1 hypothetical protein BDB00DRAFT_875727 [Zychaea mexicana]